MLELPPFAGGMCVRLHNAGLFDELERLRAGASDRERRRERDRFLQLAGVMLGGDDRRMAGHLRQRMVELERARGFRVMSIDVATLDGALTAALVVCGWEVPHRTTVYRVLCAPRVCAAQPVGAQLVG